MTTIKGQKYFTINATAGETYCISFEAGYTVNIINQTDGILTISPTEAYEDDGITASCIKLESQSFLNGFTHFGSKLYLTAEESGSIAVVRAA
ncbi:MAG: hypothetical protein ACI4DP_08450 [Candidatus Ornithomonoglobus sp.]